MAAKVTCHNTGVYAPLKRPGVLLEVRSAPGGPFNTLIQVLIELYCILKLSLNFELNYKLKTQYIITG